MYYFRMRSYRFYDERMPVIITHCDPPQFKRIGATASQTKEEHDLEGPNAMIADPHSESTSKKSVRELAEELTSLGFAISASVRDMRKNSDLSPVDEANLGHLRTALQMFDVAMADLRGIVVAGNPQLLNGQAGHDTPKTETPRKQEQPAKKQRVTRPRNPAVDAALLHTFDYEDRTEFPIGQTTLLEVMQYLEPNAKKTTLVSKVNRWKNDHDYLRWSHSEDLHRTPVGKEKADQLMAIARRDGHEQEIHDAINAALNIRK